MLLEVEVHFDTSFTMERTRAPTWSTSPSRRVNFDPLYVRWCLKSRFIFSVIYDGFDIEVALCMRFTIGSDVKVSLYTLFMMAFEVEVHFGPLFTMICEVEVHFDTLFTISFEVFGSILMMILPMVTGTLTQSSPNLKGTLTQP